MPQTEGEIHILLGLTGSVASLKAPDLIQKLKKLDIPGHEIKVQVVTTERAKHFYSQLEAEIGKIVKTERQVCFAILLMWITFTGD